MNFSSVVSTSELDANGVVFSLEALREMTRKIAGQPITINFTGKVVGKVKDATMCGSEIVATGELYDDVFLEAFYCVPMLEVDEEDIQKQDDTKLIKRVKRVLSFGLTMTPADKNVTHLEKIT